MNRSPFANGSVFTPKAATMPGVCQPYPRGHGASTGIRAMGIFLRRAQKLFFGDLHCLGKDAYRFYTEEKVVTSVV